MADCSQLSALLTDASQELSQLPQRQQDVIKYCRDATGGGTAGGGVDPAAYSACLQWVPLRRRDLSRQISTLQREIAYCNLLTGTWAITATVDSGNTVVPIYSGELRIDSWDTFSEMLRGRIDLGPQPQPTVSSNFPITQGAYIAATFHQETLEFDININIPNPTNPNLSIYLIYDGTLDVGTRVITGEVLTTYNGQIPSWSARKL